MDGSPPDGPVVFSRPLYLIIPATISLSILKFCLAAESFFTMSSLTVCFASCHLSYDMYIF